MDDEQMRDLTPQEIANAPEWATHYIVDSDDDITYESLDWWCWAANPSRKCDNRGRMSGVPIPRKEFDISQYEFSDGDMDIIIEADGGVFVSVDSDRGLYANLSRNDIIALARHSKLTPEDLTGKSS